MRLFWAVCSCLRKGQPSLMTLVANCCSPIKLESYGQESVYVLTLPILGAKFKHGIQCYHVYNWFKLDMRNRDTPIGLLLNYLV